eukprot:1101646-Rhodomonas_salina.2
MSQPGVPRHNWAATWHTARHIRTASAQHAGGVTRCCPSRLPQPQLGATSLPDRGVTSVSTRHRECDRLSTGVARIGHGRANATVRKAV